MKNNRWQLQTGFIPIYWEMLLQYLVYINVYLEHKVVNHTTAYHRKEKRLEPNTQRKENLMLVYSKLPLTPTVPEKYCAWEIRCLRNVQLAHHRKPVQAATSSPTYKARPSPPYPRWHPSRCWTAVFRRRCARVMGG